MELTILTLLRRLFTRRDKKVICVLLFASIIVSIIETISLSSLMVFIALATNFNTIFTNKYLSTIYNFLGCSSPSNFILIAGIGLVLFYFCRLAINTVHIYYMSKFALTCQQKFSIRLFERYLQFNYKDFVLTNPSSIGQIFFGYVGNTTQIITNLLSICTESFTLICIYGMLFYVNWKMTLILTVLLTIKVIIVARFFSKKIMAAGQRNQKFSLITSRTYSESYANYKFLKIIAHDKPILERFNSATQGLARANIVNNVWQGLPRYVLETVGFLMLISIILYVIYMHNNASFVIPMVSIYALAFYRFLPSINKMVIAYNQIMFTKHALAPLYNFLHHDYEQLGHEPITFKNNINFLNVSFKYTEKDTILKQANFSIKKGERVGFVGESGAGKSTITDLLMGLFTPTSGAIKIDNITLTHQNKKAWRQTIGYIPQNIYLFDGTVADNIVCGREYDEQKIILSLKKAYMYDFLQTKNSILTSVGEGGIQLSGGQKQRIGIARALYDDPEILVLDEATSSLDHETEEKIMEEIYRVNNNKTLIIVAHRLTTIKRCDTVYRIDMGTVTNVTKEHINSPSNLSPENPANIICHPRLACPSKPLGRSRDLGSSQLSPHSNPQKDII
ncbi:MAG: ABC transporter ATP-binding protein [bacterium]